MNKGQYDYQAGQDAWEQDEYDPTLWDGGAYSGRDSYGGPDPRYDDHNYWDSWGDGAHSGRDSYGGPDPRYDDRSYGDSWGDFGSSEDWGDFSSYAGASTISPPPRPRKRRRGPLLAGILAAVLVLALLGGLMIRLGRGDGTAQLSAAAPEASASADATPAPSPTAPETVMPALLPSASPTPTPAPTPSPAPTPDPAAAYTGDGAELYFRSLLDPSEQLVYDAMCAAVEGHQDKAEGLRVSDPSRIEVIYDLLWRDRPEYFWIDGGFSYTYFEDGDGILVEFYPNYCLDRQRRDELQPAVDAARNELVSRFRGCSDYEKALGVYEYLIDNTRYEANPLDFGIAAVLADRYGVCNSYAKATQYLLQQLGVQTLLVTGDAGGEKHVWNIVRIDGRYYQMDTTWGDPVTDDGSQIKTYYYFCVTDAEMLQDHIPEKSELYPACTATDANWYRREGRMAESYDEVWLEELIRRDVSAGVEVRFRCTNEELYRQYRRKLFDKGELFHILEDMGYPQRRFSYMTEDKFSAISFTVY